MNTDAAAAAASAAAGAASAAAHVFTTAFAVVATMAAAEAAAASVFISSWFHPDFILIHPDFIPTGINIQTTRKISISRKIVGIAPIWTKIWQNRSRRLKLSFPKVFHATRAQKTSFQKKFRASRGSNIYRCQG